MICSMRSEASSTEVGLVWDLGARDRVVVDVIGLERSVEGTACG